ncbi:tRNA uridine-5-carboxymethylaminomethyl(34) synthesis GTPase MnmE [uncultured Roseovarius sp.]|uniref:tRNA uridine-5-carboxymethylaminomethyl(34) synthesis GTPase MnmE n=1 Tax=uncultured Roseovarius sp. TaxID=293344 RepID=UPI00261FB1C7|nr:tRNA uridine-5-carboxymethylaminomethyl(34) synthesis GTPase MnmE [uncultured Roseovarius sp.]
METIYALSTAHGKAGVAVVRVSGPNAHLACERLCGDIPERRQATLRILHDVEGHRLDQALVLVFSEKSSFTGESTVEFQLHGSIAVVSAVLQALGRIEGLRPAEPGEFTRRALENGCLDLAQVEGLADLIDAETEAQRQQALRLFSGALGEKCEAWRTSLIRAVALLEATIDFADEDVPVDVTPEVTDLVDSVIYELDREIAGISAAERVRSGFEVAIVGAPNVGKSTLLNTLAGREAAITSEFAGTTRDVIEVRMDLDGLPVTFLDTAGLRETDDVVESMGIARARDRAARADLRVYLVDGPSQPDFEMRDGDIVIRAKADLLDTGEQGISGTTGVGIPELIAKIRATLESRVSGVGLATRERHRHAMIRGVEALEQATRILPRGEGLAEIASEELRVAIRALDSLVGRIGVEHILDEIFASFCLGK